ncbi:MAG: DUF1343 domain-containing protein [Caldilineaceae bacterium]|nr:DUF1343 domain-containing protein [Caldilineaceae bacterium]
MISPKPPVRFGIDMLLTGLLGDLTGLRTGLVTNDAATTSIAYGQMTPSRLALQRAGVAPVRLFSPEHGIGAAAPDGAVVGDMVDRLTGIPVRSLYGDQFRPRGEDLADLDLLLFDIPDVGARFYTYIWTLSYVMEACEEAGKPLWVLDRPNPISGDLRYAEGPMLDPSISTFVGRWNTPARHSLTVGELANLWYAERGFSFGLSVIKTGGWDRSMFWEETGNPFVATSPSLPTYETALVYPGICLFEGTNLSEGRGTASPLRQFGAPWLDHGALCDRFNQRGLPGVAARPVHFAPATSKHAGETCRGVMIHALQPQIRAVAIGLYLLADVIALHPDEFAWLPYPTAANQPGYGHFDRLIGRTDIRSALEANPESISAHIDDWTDTGDWVERVRPFLLY